MMDSPTFTIDAVPQHGAPPAPPGEGARYVGAARVVEVDDRRRRVQVEVPGQPGRRWAEVAIPTPALPGPGSRVLVTLGHDGGAYVTGVLGVLPRQVTDRHGASARVVEDDRGERIEVRSPEDALLFEYDPARRTARVRIPEGDLSVAVPHGDLTLAAGRTVRVRGQTVELTATLGLGMAVGDLAGRVGSTFRLGRKSARLRARTAHIEVERAAVTADRASLEGDHLETRHATIRTTADRIETDAGQAVQRFGFLYRTVTELLQTRAGRLRTLVTGAWHTRAGRADLRTKEKFKIDGERIDLG